jgi:hypothetical protein
VFVVTDTIPEFPPRTSKEHRNNCYQWEELESKEEQDNFFAEHGARWTEFAQLLCFDLVRYTIVDSMHNLLLGSSILHSTLQFNHLTQILF